MKLNLRWQLLLAIICFGLVLSLLSFQVQTSGLCLTRVPATGGTITEGIVGAPQYLNPLLSDNYPVDREIVSLIFDGLTRYDESGKLVPALAQGWTVSEDGLTVRFILRQDINWHDGEPFTADDVVFTYGLIQNDDFPGPAKLKTLWQSVDIRSLDQFTIEFTLSEPYSPFLDATTRGILPAHKIQEISAANLQDSDFNRSPIGTGPFMVNPNQDWQRSQRLRLSFNPSYWRQGTKIANLEFQFFPDYGSLLEAFISGEIQAINNVSDGIFPEVASMPDIRLFTAISSRFTTLLFNLSDSGSPAIKSVNTRQALAYALDRQALVDGVLNGQGLIHEGPYLPTSWAYNPQILTKYNYIPVTSTVRLDAAGWLLPDGQTIRQKDGESLSLQLITLDDPLNNALADGLADQWAEVGIDIKLMIFDNIIDFRQSLSSREFDIALVEMTPTGDPDLYDFWSQEAIIRGQNFSGWNHRRASEALENGRKLWDIEERLPFYDLFLLHYNNELPALTLYQHVYTYALSGEIKMAKIGRIAEPRDRYTTLSDWFLLYRDITINCPMDDA